MKRFLSIGLALILLTGTVFPAAALTVGEGDTSVQESAELMNEVEVNSGSCGENVSYTLYANGTSPETYTLSITGSGAMADYSPAGAEPKNEAPWYDEYKYMITSVTIAEGVTTVGNCAFRSCSELISVTLPDSVVSIGSEAFAGCNKLSSVSFGSGLETIDTNAFSSCGFTGITLPDSVETIEEYAFANCEQLGSVTLPKSVTTIGDSAFTFCESLQTVTMGGRVTDWGSNVFYYCTALQSVIVNEYEVACYSDYSAHFPVGVTVTYKMPAGSVYNTWHVSSGAVQLDLYTDGTLIVSGTGAMADYVQAYLPPWSGNSDKIQRVVIGEGITSVGAYSFYDAHSLASVSLPTTLTSIGKYAFNNTALTSVAFANKDTLSLGERAFFYCQSLTDIDFGSGTISPAENVFEDCDALASVHVTENVVMNGSYNGA